MLNLDKLLQRMAGSCLPGKKSLMKKDALLEKISRFDKLPMLPDVAMRIIDLSNDPDLYASKVAEVISTDPVLSARLLQVSNSSMFPFRREITNLNEALAILGVQLTMSIAVGFAIIDMMRARESEESGFNHDAFWRKSVLSAIAAIEMCNKLKAVQQGDLFVAALMQDIGMVALENIAGKKYAQLVNSARSHLDLVELERRVFGIDHAEVGTAILTRWKLPQLHIDAVRNSHHLLEAKPMDQLNDLEYSVAFSGLLAEQWIAETPYAEQLNASIKRSITRISEEGLKHIVSNTVEAIPGANEVFKMTLLEQGQLPAID